MSYLRRHNQNRTRDATDWTAIYFQCYVKPNKKTWCLYVYHKDYDMWYQQLLAETTQHLQPGLAGFLHMRY